MNNLLNELDILRNVDQRVSEVDPVALEALTGNIGAVKRGEKVLGEVQNQTCRRLYYVSLSLACKAKMMHLQAEIKQAEFEVAGVLGRPADKELERVAEDLHNASHRLRAESEFIKELFWAQCRSDHDYWQEGIGIRDGWALVAMKSRGSATKQVIATNMPKELREMLGLPGGDEEEDE